MIITLRSGDYKNNKHSESDLFKLQTPQINFHKWKRLDNLSPRDDTFVKPAAKTCRVIQKKRKKYKFIGSTISFTIQPSI